MTTFGTVYIVEEYPRFYGEDPFSLPKIKLFTFKYDAVDYAQRYEREFNSSVTIFEISKDSMNQKNGAFMDCGNIIKF